MAQTKRKRQTKHRGNAAGGIVSRGRTGRPLSAEEKKRTDRDTRREERLNRKPTWKSAGTRAALAGAFMFVFLLFVLHPKHGASPVLPALLEAVVAMLLYLVLGFYLEMYLWRRRQAKKAAAQRR